VRLADPRPVSTSSIARRAPSLRAMPFLHTRSDTDVALLTDRQREELARIGLRVRLPPRMVIYREDSPAECIFVVAEGVVKSYRDLPSGRRSISMFLFARDLFGLAEAGRYVNTAQAVTPVTLYRLPLEELIVLLQRDPDLQCQFLVKVTHELRKAQRRAIAISRRDAAGRLAMFIAFVQRHTSDDRLVPLPMTRSDIAGFLGLSAESVSRAAANLERRGLVKFEGRSAARILDATGLARLVEAV
jgi:CRP/FNR family transcriptional regulator